MHTQAARQMAEPLHQVLKTIILKMIDGGSWPPHSQIASERELCQRYSVSRTTTRKVMSDLIHEGVVYTVTGKGTFVAETRLRQELQPLVGFTQDLSEQGVAVVSRVLAFERIEADDVLAGHLGIQPHASVVRLQRCREIGGQPHAIQTTYLPEHLCPGLLRHDFATRSLFDTLRTEYGLVLREGSTVIKSGLAAEWEARMLNALPPSPVLRTLQTTYLADGQVIEYCVSAFHGELFELTVGTGVGYVPNSVAATRTGSQIKILPPLPQRSRASLRRRDETCS